MNTMKFLLLLLLLGVLGVAYPAAAQDTEMQDLTLGTSGAGQFVVGYDSTDETDDPSGTAKRFELPWTVSGANAYRAAGSVGIGTAPAQALDVVGNIKVSGLGGFGDGAAAGPSFSFTADPDTGIYRSATNQISMTMAGAEAVRLEATGRARFFDVVTIGDGAVGAPGLAFDSDPDTGIYRSATNQFDLVTAGVSRVTVDASGNVGIGTSSPNYNLEVQGSTGISDGVTATALHVYNSYTDASNYERAVIDWSTTANVVTIGTEAAGAGTARPLRLTSKGVAFMSNHGTSNTFLGEASGNFTLSGIANTAVGHSAGAALTTGGTNTAIGSFALDAETTGIRNTAIGGNALTTQQGAGNNTAVGYSAGAVLSTGDFNTVLGSGALDAETTGYRNTAIGGNALTSQQGASNNTVIGYNSGFGITTSGQNVAIGVSTLASEQAGSSNTAIGHNALPTQNGGNFNTALGRDAGYAITTGDNNTVLGADAADNLTSGSNNLFIGYLIDAPSATASNQMSIGNLLFSEGIDGTAATISTGNLGIAIAVPTGKLHVDQASASGAMPVVRLDQGDVDDSFIDFIGTSGADTTSSISTHGTSGATTDHIQIEVNGVKAWIAISTNDPSA